MLGYLFTGISFGFYAAISPGPLQTLLLALSLQNGWKRTLPAAFAPLISDIPIVTLMLLILTQTPDWFLSGLRIVGGGFILFLAWRVWKSARKETFFREPDAQSGRQSLGQAAVMNLLNPNPYIFWSLVAGPILLDGWRQSPALGVGFLGGFYGMFITGTAMLIVVFATTRHLGHTATRTLGILSAAALAVFGVYQLWQGVISWM